MKTMRYSDRMNYRLMLVLIIVFGLVFVSCDQKSKTTESESNEVENGDAIVDSQELSSGEQKLIEFINNEPSNLRLVQSLRWELMSETNPKMIEAYALLNTDGNPVKIVESYSYGNFGNEGQREYYLDQNEVYAIVDRYDAWVDSSYAVFNEKQVFYENGEAITCKHRSSDFAEEIESQPWTVIRPENISNLSEIQDLLSGENRFRTHFISYIESGELLFLLFGEPKDSERYHTAVMIQEMTPFLRDLLTNYKANKFRPIDIEFDIVGGDAEPEFRVLRSAKWAD